VRLPDGRVWLRVADPEWADPLDPSWAAERVGRWNPPASFPTLHLNCDVGSGRELAWFPATKRSRARAVMSDSLPLGEWRHAVGWGDLERWGFFRPA
jgi:hypothetical protein